MVSILKYTYHPEQYGWPANMSGAELDLAAGTIISQMTLDEKIAMMGEQNQWSRIRIGIGIIFRKLLPYKASGNERLKIPPILFTDGPRGVTFCGGRSTTFPVSMARGASWDIGLEKRIGDVIGKEARAVHSNYSGSVCLNVLRHPAWGRAQETYGEDSFHLGEMASALVEGVQQHNVLACPKHFAANSIENSRYVVSANMDERTLREVYLPHFKKCIDRGALTIMSAYNRLNGEYCGHHHYLLTGILRNEWGFKGYVTSDWDNGIYDTEKPIKAGMNVEMSYAVYYTRKKVKALLKSGKIQETDIDKLVLPIIRTQIWLASQPEKQKYPETLLQAPEHVALAQEAAEKSAVLLKNERSFLPLQKNKIKKIAVVGSLATVKNTGDKGSSWTHISKDQIVSPYEGIRNYFSGSNVEIITADGHDTAALQKACDHADAVIVCVGMRSADEGEYISLQPKKMKNKDGKQENWVVSLGLIGQGGDRESLSLNEPDIRTIRLAAECNINLVVCLTGGSAITVETWHESVPAILQTFYNGMQGGHALARILFGDVNPSGKLPFTVPVSESDLPPFNAYCHEAEYGYYHGYTLMDKKQFNPRYPFGFGLSYTSFEFSNMNVKTSTVNSNTPLEIEVDIQNTGNMFGEEVIQLYIGFSRSCIDRPVKLLRGFKKVHLDPGQKKTISFVIEPHDLCYYDPVEKKYRVENMEHEVYAGNTSETEKLLKTVFTTSGF
jgi:beta-glucosidase